MSGPTEFVGAEGNRLAATRFEPSGNKKATILLLHGGGQTRHAWDGAGPVLAAAGYEAISIDARGHGESDWVPSAHYTMSHMADDLETVAGHFEPVQLVAVGASMGGLMTMLVNGRSPATFAANVFVDITPRMQASGVDRIMTFMAAKSAEGFGSVEEAADAIAAYMPNRPRPKDLSGLSKNLRQRATGRFHWHWDPAFAAGPHNILTDQDAAEERLVAGCERITAPTLLVRGARSDLVSPADVDHFRQVVPHAEYDDVSKAGHMIVGDRNDVFVAVVRDFLDRTFASVEGPSGKA